MDDEDLEALERKARLRVFTMALLYFGGVLWAGGKLISVYSILTG